MGRGPETGGPTPEEAVEQEKTPEQV